VTKAVFLFGRDFVFTSFPDLAPPGVEIRGAAIAYLELPPVKISHAGQVHHAADISFPVPVKLRAPAAAFSGLRMPVAAECAHPLNAAAAAAHAGP